MTTSTGEPVLPPSAEVATQIRSFIIENFLLGQDDVGSHDSLLDKGVVDSTGVLEVVAFLEETFDIAVTDDEMVTENLDTIERLARFVVDKRAEKARLMTTGAE